MQTAPSQNFPSLCCGKGGMLGYGWNLESEDLNPQTEPYQLDDLEQIPFHISGSISSSATQV